jgi:hypothetical protein
MEKGCVATNMLQTKALSMWALVTYGCHCNVLDNHAKRRLSHNVNK